MKLVATRGEVEAYADDGFDPATDDVEIRQPGRATIVISWQRALKWGYWEDAS